MVMAEEEGEHYDDMTMALQIQQFLDEWHYRILHSGLAFNMDRIQVMIKAMELFECHGVLFSEEDKALLAERDEAEFIQAIVQRMPLQLRKTFDHFALQLQLVVSTATRVRHALDSGVEEETARVMEDGDTGISQQVLKQAIIEASNEVGDLIELHDSWAKNMEARVSRLLRCASDADHASRQLQALQTQLDAFSGDQASKSKKVLSSLASGQDQALLSSCISSWYGLVLKIAGEKDIHKKFRKEILDTQAKLIEYKAAQLGNAKNVLQRRAAGAANDLLGEILRLWQRCAQEEKEDRETAGQLEETKAKLASFKSAQKESSKKVMMRMSAGNDASLILVCFQAWMQALAEYKKNKEFEDLVRSQEAQFKEFMDKKSTEARGVMNRMMGASSTGLLASYFKEWAEVYMDEKRHREWMDTVANADTQFSKLNERQRKAAKNFAYRTNKADEESVLETIFLAWCSEAKTDRVINHYSGKMDAKKQQLEAVQSMFKSFATQLEQGIGTTPRSTRKGHRSERSKEGKEGSHSTPNLHADARPPLPA